MGVEGLKWFNLLEIGSSGKFINTAMKVQVLLKSVAEFKNVYP
jgi:hypothetical protein